MMNKAVKMGLGLAGLLVLTFSIGMLYLVSYVEENLGSLEQNVSDALGRQVAFKEDVEIHWSLTPSLVIQGVQIDNPKWAKGEHLLQAESAVLKFSLLGLIAQHLDITHVELSKADIILESADKGKHNWVFGSGETSASPAMPNSISIKDSRLRYRLPGKSEHLIEIGQLEIEGLDDDTIEAEANIQYDKLPLSVSMESGSRVVVETQSGQAHQSYRLAARIEKDEQFLDLKEVEIAAGENLLTGTIRLPISGRQGLQIDLRSDAVDLTPHLADDGGGDTVLKTVLEYELKRASLKDRTGKAHIEIKQVMVGDLQLHKVILDGNIDSGHVQLSVKDDAGKINTNVEVKPAKSLWQVAFSQKSAVDIGELIEADTDKASRTSARAALDINLSGTGKSLKGVFGSAQGKMSLKIGAGKLSKAMAGLLPMGSVLDNLLTTIGKQDSSQLECAVLTMDVKDGVANSKDGLAVRTPAVNVLGGGTVKLATGEIDFHFKTVRRKSIGVGVQDLAEKFVRLSGTLREPKTEVNTAGFLVHGGGALATGGVTLFYDKLAKRLQSTSNPCKDVLKGS